MKHFFYRNKFKKPQFISISTIASVEYDQRHILTDTNPVPLKNPIQTKLRHQIEEDDQTIEDNKNVRPNTYCDEAFF